MSNFDIILAWKDEDFSSSLSEAQRSQLSESPVGNVELLSDEEMELLAGGGGFTIDVDQDNKYGDNNASVAVDYSYCDIYTDNRYRFRGRRRGRK